MDNWTDCHNTACCSRWRSMKVLGEDTEEGMVGMVGADIVVVGGEVDVVGWAWGVDTDMDVDEDMDREDLSGQTDGIQDFTGSCKNGCTSTGNGTWGCQYPGMGS